MSTRLRARATKVQSKAMPSWSVACLTNEPIRCRGAGEAHAAGEARTVPRNPIAGIAQAR